jgi:hypothetical protein
MATGLNALVTGLGSLVGGAGLQGAFNAALNTAGAMPDIGSVIGGAAGSATAGNLANIAIGGIIGGEAGGLPGALLGAGGAAVGAGIDQAGGIREFIRDPFGNITGAIGLGGEVLSGAQLAAMEASAQVGLGSLAQNTTGGSLDPTGEYVPLPGGGYAIWPANPGEIPLIAITGPRTGVGTGITSGTSLTGSNAGQFLGGVSSALPGMIYGGGGTSGPGNIGGILTTSPDGLNISAEEQGGFGATPSDGITSGVGTGTGQTGIVGGPGGISPDGMPIGIPGVDAPYAPGSSQGQIGAVDGIVGGDPFGSIGTSGTQPGGQYNDSKFDLIGNLIPSLGPWDFTGATSGPGTPNATGLLDTGTGLAGTGPGGNGLGGDGAGGDGLGGDGLGMGSGGFNYSGLLGGMTPGGMGDPVSFLKPRAFGTKKKGPASFYGKLQAPKKRKGITVRRA